MYRFVNQGQSCKFLALGLENPVVLYPFVLSIRKTRQRKQQPKEYFTFSSRQYQKIHKSSALVFRAAPVGNGVSGLFQGGSGPFQEVSGPFQGVSGPFQVGSGTEIRRHHSSENRPNSLTLDYRFFALDWQSVVPRKDCASVVLKTDFPFHVSLEDCRSCVPQDFPLAERDCLSVGFLQGVVEGLRRAVSSSFCTHVCACLVFPVSRAVTSGPKISPPGQP